MLAAKMYPSLVLLGDWPPSTGERGRLGLDSAQLDQNLGPGLITRSLNNLNIGNRQKQKKTRSLSQLRHQRQ